MQPDCVNLWYSKLRLVDLIELRVEISKIYDIGCKYIGIRKSEFVAKTQFLSGLALPNTAL